MTSYAVDEDTSTLLRTWPTGRGQRAAIMSKLPDITGVDVQLRLAATLTSLSEALWRCYTHPGRAADDPEGNGEGWRREQTREAFTEVVASIRQPNLPDADGAILESYDPVEERAHQVGRALHAINDGELIEDSAFNSCPNRCTVAFGFREVTTSSAADTCRRCHRLDRGC